MVTEFIKESCIVAPPNQKRGAIYHNIDENKTYVYSMSRWVELASKGKEISEIKLALGELYPIEVIYGSRCSLFWYGLRDGIITPEEYDLARIYYGTLWNYTGD